MAPMENLVLPTKDQLKLLTDHEREELINVLISRFTEEDQLKCFSDQKKDELMNVLNFWVLKLQNEIQDWDKLANEQVRLAVHTWRNEDLEHKNTTLRRELEATNKIGADNVANIEEISRRESLGFKECKTVKNKKYSLQQELVVYRQEYKELQPKREKTIALKKGHEDRYAKEKWRKEKNIAQPSSLKKEKEQIEPDTKLKQEKMSSKHEYKMFRYHEEYIKNQNNQKREEYLLKYRQSQLEGLLEYLRSQVSKEISDSKLIVDDHRRVKRERECIICHSEEARVLSLPCAHKIVCVACNVGLEKKRKKDCLVCEVLIDKRIHVRCADDSVSFHAMHICLNKHNIN